MVLLSNLNTIDLSYYFHASPQILRHHVTLVAALALRNKVKYIAAEKGNHPRIKGDILYYIVT